MVLVATLLAAVSVGVVARGAARAASPDATRRTIVILDGVLFGDVQQGRRFLFGWSDWPVLDLPQKLRLMRLFGQARTAVQRSFCTPAQLLPRGARVSMEFAVPLDVTAPRYRVDRNADGIIDRIGRFKPGGTRFPVSTRC